MADRRASLVSASSGRRDYSPQRRSQDPFDDEYAESVAASFDISEDARSLRSRNSVEMVETRASLYQNPLPVTRPSIQALPRHSISSRSRNSTPKNTVGVSQEPNSQSLQNQSQPASSHVTSAQTGTPSSAHRSLSSASIFSVARSSSPSQSISGPSHPYAMYPQNLGGISRSGSTATASTFRTHSQTAQSRAPAHPYGLYTQSVGNDGNEGMQSNDIPVGFPGSDTTFHRRIGPEGEEQDIVGPDGHTEQLPPYTRFPEEIQHKFVAGSALPAIGENGNSDMPSQSSHTQPSNPEAASPSTPHPGTAPSPVNPFSNAYAIDDESEGGQSEKSWSEKSWKERIETRVCGIKVRSLAIIFTVILAIFLAGAIGASVGVALVKQENKAKPAPTSTSMATPYPAATGPSSTFVDASTVPTPTASIPALPPGTYQIDIGIPSIEKQGCVPQNQASAWDCSLGGEYLQFTIGHTNSTSPQISMFPPPNQSPWDIQYGSQPPTISSGRMQLVTDAQYPQSIAYQFQTLYNKLVVVHDELLSVTPPDNVAYYDPYPSKRSEKDDSIDGEPTWSRDIADAHQDKPWFCWWNQTFIEGFFYLNTSQNSAVLSASPYSGSTTGAMTSNGYSASPTQASATYGPSTTSLPWASGNQQYAPDSGSPTGISQVGKAKRHDYHSSAAGPSQQAGISPYPLAVKIEERRLQSADPTPQTCTQMQFDFDQEKWIPYITSEGTNNTVVLEEVDPTKPSIYTPGGQTLSSRSLLSRVKASLHKRDPGELACYCQWNSSPGYQ